MLDSMRKLSKGIISKLLMGLLVVSFAVWGVGDILKNSGPSYAAKVGGETVSLQEFQRASAVLKRQLSDSGMQKIPSGAVEQSAIRQLVQSKLNLLAMQDVGLYVNEEAVGKHVAALPQFQDDHGKFSGTIFANALKAQNMPEKFFVSELKKDIAAQFLSDSLSMQDAIAPTSVLQLDAVTNGETRDVVLLTVPAVDAMDEKNTAAFKEYYEQNKEMLYMQPEARSLDYVALSAADVDKLVDAAITDEMVADASATNPDLDKRLVRMKLRDAQRDIVMQDVNNTIEDELAAGKSLQDALAKAGIQASPRHIENITAEAAKAQSDDVIKTVAEQGFGLHDGEVSGLISTKSGTRLMVAVKAIKPASPKPYEAVASDVKQRLGKDLARDAAQAKAQSVKEALAKAPNWQAVAEEYKLSSRAVSAVARPVTGKQASGIPASLQAAIFEREVGEVAGPLTQPNGDQVLALVKESHLPSLATIQNQANKPTEAMANKLANDIENRAYLSFAKKHPVKVNPAAIRSVAAAEAE